jgi:glycosyltransferase involved in cell wall biosynthesis
MTPAFSVIMPFYNGDPPTQLAQALQSLVQQTLRANEIVLIQDGPVSQEHQAMVRQWSQKYPEINWLILPKNLGLSGALNEGIKAAKHEWLARMDADDLCLDNRFEKQMTEIVANPSLSILGSWIEEFDEQMKRSLAIRKLPQSHQAIVKYAQWRCPFNHMSVMYRKSALLELGLYKNYGAVGDDYELWARFLMNGYQSTNLQEVLVQARTGNLMFKNRRRGMPYLKNEIKEINALYQLGLIGPFHYCIHFVIKTITRLSPSFMVKLIYKVLRKTS